MTDEIEKDEWEKALDIQLENIQNCQKSKNLIGCETCSEILDCIIRKEYVKAVYESMNKGSGGGFEF
jgi:hypothetical protein